MTTHIALGRVSEAQNKRKSKEYGKGIGKEDERQLRRPQEY